MGQGNEGKIPSEARKEVERRKMENMKEAVEKEIAEVEGEVKKVTQELSAEEKLIFRELETTYLKAQLDLTKATEILKESQKKYTEELDAAFKRHVINPAEHMWDAVKLMFVKR